MGGPRKIVKNPNPATSCDGEYWNQEGQQRAAERRELLERVRAQVEQSDTEGQ